MVLGAEHKGSVPLIEELFGCLLLWPVTSLALVCACVKVLGFEQGQFMVQCLALLERAGVQDFV